MPSWIIAAIFGVGVAGWAYNKLAHLNGNAEPKNNMIGAAVVGFIVFLVFFSLMKLVFGF